MVEVDISRKGDLRWGNFSVVLKWKKMGELSANYVGKYTVF